MSKHTPGPWTQYEGEVRAAGHGLISRSYYGSPDGPGAANARLIAAAPDLLEALQKLSIVMRELHDHWDNDRDMKVGKGLLALSGLLPGYDKRIDEIHAAIAKAEGTS